MHCPVLVWGELAWQPLACGPQEVVCYPWARGHGLCLQRRRYPLQAHALRHVSVPMAAVVKLDFREVEFLLVLPLWL